MKKRLILTAAVLAVSGFCYPVSSARADDAAMSPTNETGTQTSDKAVVKAADRSLANVVDASTRHDGFKDLSNDLQREDMRRFSNDMSSNTAAGVQNNDANAQSNADGTNGNNANGTNNAGTASNATMNNPAAGTSSDANAVANNKDNANPTPAADNPGDMSPVSFQQHDDINTAVDQLHQDWKDKYGKDFNFSNDMQAQVFGDGFQIMVGNIGDLARTASDRMAPDTNIRPSDAPKISNDKGGDLPTQDPNFDNKHQQGNVNMTTPAEQAARADEHLNGLQHYATVYLPANGTSRAVTLLLTNHNDSADDWKVVVPRGVTEQQIHDSLLKHLQTLDSQKASWPADETDAYKAVTREVLGAFSESCSTHRMHHGMNGNDMNNAGNTNANGQNGGTGDTGNSANH